VSESPHLTAMVTAALPPRRDRIAVAGSIAVHLCALLVLATLPRAEFPVDDPDERALFASIIRIERRPPLRLVQPRRALAVTAVPRLQPQALPVIHAAVTIEHAARRLVVATEQRAFVLAAVPARVPRTEVSRVAPEVRASVPPAAPAATPAPVVAPAPSPVVAQREDGIGNFGETYPAAIDPSARGALLAGISGVIVRIIVDENGHATSIEFVRPPADATLREELRTRLLAARFVPANCNGLRCTGTLELRN
jgi:hypothetical protein